MIRGIVDRDGCGSLEAVYGSAVWSGCASNFFNHMAPHSCDSKTSEMWNPSSPHGQDSFEASLAEGCFSVKVACDGYETEAGPFNSMHIAGFNTT